MHILSKTVIIATIFGVAAQAETLHIQGGAGIWNASPSGSLRYENSSWVSAEDGLGYSTEITPYLWVNIEHTLPYYIPNLRLEYTGIDYSGRTNGVIGWGPWSYSDNALSELKINEYDAIFYYTLLDKNFWMKLDVGVDLKFINARYSIQDDYGFEATYNESDSFVVPQGYLRARVEIPNTQIGIETNLQYVGSGNSELYDMRFKTDYTFKDLWSNVQPAVEVGYRKQRILIDENDYDTKVDIDLDGFYLGAMFRF
ncbi:MAG: TIGR04219 family outer membrane beta-barrel protein [Sulfurovaceae bacterium]|nr:TIGR04219 family outer membrane beta-barrel protein [Sulfurovaceae bacterium]